MEKYRKMIAAFIGALVPVLAGFVPGIGDVLTPEIQGALSVLLATALTYAVPNKINGENVMDAARRAALPPR